MGRPGVWVTLGRCPLGDVRRNWVLCGAPHLPKPVDTPRWPPLWVHTCHSPIDVCCHVPRWSICMVWQVAHPRVEHAGQRTKRLMVDKLGVGINMAGCRVASTDDWWVFSGVGWSPPTIGECLVRSGGCHRRLVSSGGSGGRHWRLVVVGGGRVYSGGRPRWMG